MEQSNEIINQGPPKREPVFNNLPIGTLALLAVMAAIHLLVHYAPSEVFMNWANNNALSPARLFQYFENNSVNLETIKPLIYHQFLHAGEFHLLMNSAMLFQVGAITEIGLMARANPISYNDANLSAKMKSAILFICFFLICGIGSALGYILLNHNSMTPMVGASGAISGAFGGYLWSAFLMAPKGTSVVKQLLSSAFVFLIINVVLAAAARNSGVIPIAWEGHLFGFITGLVLYPLFFKLSR